MGKKYTPSGYQIINIDVTARTSGTPFTPETEDEKLLHEILVLPSSTKKPILLFVLSGIGRFCGFPTIFENSVTLISGVIGNTSSIAISTNGDKLVMELHEE